MNLMNIAMVALGGAIGSVSRFLITLLMTRALPDPFPFGTLMANYLGCLLIGILMAIFTHRIEQHELRLFFTTGMMGGLTTFSTFSYESMLLLREGNFLKGITNISASLLGCLLLTFIGFRLSLHFIGK
jgi:CrcB protein